MNKENHFLGLIGAFLGALVGALPMIIVGILGFFTGWFGILTALGSYFGYKLFQGPKSMKFAKGAIIGSTFAVTTLLSIAFGMLYISSGTLVGSPSIFVIIPFFAGSVGYSMIRRKVILYVDPDFYSAAISSYTKLSEDENTKNAEIFIADRNRLTPVRTITGINYLVSSIALIVCLLIAIYFENIVLLISLFFSIIGYALGVIISFPYTSIGMYQRYVLIKSNDKYIKVDLLKLNLNPNYNFSTTFTLKGVNVHNFVDGEFALLYNTLNRLADDIYNNSFKPSNGVKLSGRDKKTYEVYNHMTLIKNTKTHYKIAFTSKDGFARTDKIPKVFSGFAPFFPNETKENVPMKFSYVFLSLFLTVLPFLLGGIISISTTIMSDTISNYSYSSETYYYDEISYKIPSNHIEIATNIFENSSSTERYGVNHISTLGSLSPAKTFAELVNNYSKTHTILYSSEYIENFYLADGTKIDTAEVHMENTDGSKMLIRFLFFEDRNLLISFVSTSNQITHENLTELMRSVSLHNFSSDYLSGNTFSSNFTETAFTLYEDGTYDYTFDRNTDEIASTGTYNVFSGDDAISIASNADFGVNASALEELITNNMDGYMLSTSSPAGMLSQYEFDAEGNIIGLNPDIPHYKVSKDTFYTLVLTDYSTGATNMFIGFYIEELGCVDLLNLKTLTQEVFKNEG